MLIFIVLRKRARKWFSKYYADFYGFRNEDRIHVYLSSFIVLRNACIILQCNQNGFYDGKKMKFDWCQNQSLKTVNETVKRFEKVVLRKIVVSCTINMAKRPHIVPSFK